ncbi:MAG: DUF1330 domain-containing protein [Bacteroidota bacterium]
MPAYLIAMVKVHDAETYRKYTAKTPDIIKAYGGKFLTRGGKVITTEGEAFKDRLVLLEFPSQQAALDMLNSPEYKAAVKDRHASSEGRFLVIEGVADGAAPDASVVKSG